MGSFDKKSDEKYNKNFIDSRQVDTGAQLDASLNAPLDPNESLRIRCVNFKRCTERFVSLTIYFFNQGGKLTDISYLQCAVGVRTDIGSCDLL